MRIILVPWLLVVEVAAYWDYGSTTIMQRPRSMGMRTSRFRWMRTESDYYRMFFPWWDWKELSFRKRLFAVAGISYEFTNLSTATILNRRCLITAANFLDPYMDKQRDLRIWALGRAGDWDTPFRYRVWRVTRLFPRSVNPEHQHGPWAYHSPRHDIALIHSLDQMFLWNQAPWQHHFAYRAFIAHKHHFALERDDVWFSGSGFETIFHIYTNFEILHYKLSRDLCVDCSNYLPKWWGKFMCFKNIRGIAGVQNGAGLYDKDLIIGIGCFEIRYNDDKIFVFTDIRYYNYFIYQNADIMPGEYYEYAYPQWSVYVGWVYGSGNEPYIPGWQVQDDMYPMGKKK